MDALNDIAVFVQVVESGSFTTAAERLTLSKSVVSKYVTRLEKRIGVRLLHRTTRQLSLTEAGRGFYERCRYGLEEIEAAEAEVSLLQQKPRGSLRINAPMSFGIAHLAPIIGDFMAEYPDVSVDMNLDDKQVDIVAEGFDLALRISELSDSSLVARKLAPCRHVICASPDYLKQHGTPQTPQDLTKHNALTYRYQKSSQQWHFTDLHDQPISINVKGALQMNNSLAIRKALLAGAGITRIPSFIVGEDIRQGRLKTVLTDFTTLELSIFIIYANRQHLSPKIRAFIDFLASRITDTPYWDRKIFS